MIVYERINSTAKLRATTRDCPYILALSFALFETRPQNRVRAAIFATQRRSTTRFKFISLPSTNLFSYSLIPLKNNNLQILYELGILFEYLLPKTA